MKKTFIKTGEGKHKINQLSKLIKNEINAIQDKKWSIFLEKQGKNPLSSRNFWQKINYTKKNKNSKINASIGKLVKDGKQYLNDEEKGNLFKSILEETFAESTNENFKNNFKNNVETHVINELIKNQQNITQSNLFTMQELNQCIKSLKAKLSSGLDKINNLHIKNAPISLREKILDLFNKTITENHIPKELKTALITMIPKKDNDKSNPKNYRPISLTSNIAKLGEKLISIRLKKS